MKTKICCISSIQEAQIAIRYGASALGLVGPMPSGPGVITVEQIREIAAATPAHIDTFLLTSETSAKAIIEQYQCVKTTTIQIVDELKEGSYRDIRVALPHVRIVQVVHVANEATIQEALSIAPEVDALLLDSGNPNAAIKTLGGTGKMHNWNISRQIVTQASKPVFLAGGLKPTNVAEAIRKVQPYGVDLCSGLRTNGHLDEQLVAQFFEAVNNV